MPFPRFPAALIVKTELVDIDADAVCVGTSPARPPTCPAHCFICSLQFPFTPPVPPGGDLVAAVSGSGVLGRHPIAGRRHTSLDAEQALNDISKYIAWLRTPQHPSPPTTCDKGDCL